VLETYSKLTVSFKVAGRPTAVALQVRAGWCKAATPSGPYSNGRIIIRSW